MAAFPRDHVAANGTMALRLATSFAQKFAASVKSLAVFPAKNQKPYWSQTFVALRGGLTEGLNESSGSG